MMWADDGAYQPPLFGSEPIEPCGFGLAHAHHDRCPGIPPELASERVYSAAEAQMYADLGQWYPTAVTA